MFQCWRNTSAVERACVSVCVCVCVVSSLISDLLREYTCNKKYIRLQRYTDNKIFKMLCSKVKELPLLSGHFLRIFRACNYVHACACIHRTRAWVMAIHAYIRMGLMGHHRAAIILINTSLHSTLQMRVH